MPKLTPTQTEALVNAAQRDDGNVLPLPENVTPTLINRVIKGLKTRGLIKEQDNLYSISKTGREAVADQLPTPPQNPKAAKKIPQDTEAEKTPTKKKSKKQQLIELLERKDGTSLEELETTLSWKKHTIRGTISTLKSRDGYTIISTKNENGERIYSIKNPELL